MQFGENILYSLLDTGIGGRHMKKYSFIIGLSSFICLFLCFFLIFESRVSHGADLTSQEIIQKARDKQFPANSVAQMKMIMINKRGDERTREIKTWRKLTENNESRSLAQFLSPPDVKGTKFLVIEHIKGQNEVFIYFPSMKKVRRIAGEQKNTSFMGSDFTYADMEGQEADKSTHTLLRTETHGTPAGKKLECHVIETVPLDPEEFQYSKIISWVEKDRLILWKSEFYDNEGRLLKILDVAEVKRIAEIDLPVDFSMTNVQKNHKTVIKIDDFQVALDIPDSTFEKRQLKR